MLVVSGSAAVLQPALLAEEGWGGGGAAAAEADLKSGSKPKQHPKISHGAGGTGVAGRDPPLLAEPTRSPSCNHPDCAP
jgi:hypothetical protein